jgi:[acyl-carrier-protein] S-malonyltransferase
LNAAGVAGHSLGEFSALAAAEVLGVEETIELAALRGKLMADAGGPDEGMAAVLKLPQSKVELIVESARTATGLEIRVANFNTPAQFVVSGKKDALDQVADLVKKEKGRAIPLPVSGAFHSPLMKEANKELAKVMEKKDWREPKHPLFFNATGKPEADPAKIKDIMIRQMVSPVRWIALIETMWEQGARTFYEFGPKGVLTRMLGPILKEKTEEYQSEAVNGLETAQKIIGG